uniref:RHS repeat-associated core domain-containing protein n=1 Tax=Edaphovirga cremea TaxID=2267246 RepID=UPI0039897434
LSTWGQADVWPLAASNDDILSCNLRFAGQYADDESGLHYNRFRYYDNETGQYLTPDPIGLAGGVNPYGYVHNPTGYIDPLGLACICPPKDAKNKVRKEQGPKEITRIDAPETSVPVSQWHAHGKNGGAINIDGSIHDGDPEFSKKH